MKSVNLKVMGINSKIIPTFKINNEIVKFKKNEFDSYETTYQTDKDEIELTISRNLELASKLWWLYALISFIVSIFGIFEPPYDKKNIVIDCKFKIKLNEFNEIKLTFNSLATNGRALEINTLNEYEEIKNEYFVDKKLKMRWIFLLIFKLLIWIVLIIVAIYLIINKI